MAYSDAEKMQFIRIYRDNLCNISKTCKDFGDRHGGDGLVFSRDTFYRWCKDDDDFRKKIADSNVEVADAVEQNLIMQGLGANNVTAMIFFLKNKHPDYKEKMQVEGNFKVNNYGHLTEQQIQARIGELAGKLGIDSGPEGSN